MLITVFKMLRTNGGDIASWSQLPMNLHVAFVSKVTPCWLGQIEQTIVDMPFITTMKAIIAFAWCSLSWLRTLTLTQQRLTKAHCYNMKKIVRSPTTSSPVGLYEYGNAGLTNMEIILITRSNSSAKKSSR